MLAQILSTLGVGTKDLARWCGEAEIATPGICSHLAGCKTFLRVKSADCRSVENPTRTALRIPVSASCVLTPNAQTNLRHSQTEGYAICSHFVLLRVGAAWPRLGRAFRTAPVSRQTINQKRFVTNRAFTHALPPSSGLRSVPFTGVGLFFPAAL